MFDKGGKANVILGLSQAATQFITLIRPPVKLWQ